MAVPTPGAPSDPNQGNQPKGGGAPGFSGNYNYADFTNWLGTQEAKPSQYQKDVLGGKYLDLGSNPWLTQYMKGAEGSFQRNLGNTLAQVTSPFANAGTMGMSGIMGDVRGITGANALADFSNSMNRTNLDAYLAERGFQTQTSSDLSGQTNALRGAAASAYGADQGYRSAKANADATLAAARMAQALGYDKLAADMMFQYEQLNMQATMLAMQAASGYMTDTSNIMSQWGTGHNAQPGGGSFYGPFSGAAGGAMTGAGIAKYFDLFGGSNNAGGNAGTPPVGGTDAYGRYYPGSNPGLA